MISCNYFFVVEVKAEVGVGIGVEDGGTSIEVYVQKIKGTLQNNKNICQMA